MLAKLIMGFIFIIAFIAFLIKIFLLMLRLRFYKTRGRSIFQDIYSSSQPLPKYEYRSSYGYPGFTVKFKTKSEKVTAETEGRNVRFITEIEQLCKSTGRRKYPFDVTRSICIISEEELNDMLEYAKEFLQ